MAEFEDEIKSSIDKLSKSIAEIKKVADSAAKLAASLNSANASVQDDIQAKLRLTRLNKQLAEDANKNLQSSINQRTDKIKAAKLEYTAAQQIFAQKQKDLKGLTVQNAANDAVLMRQRAAMETATSEQLNYQRKFIAEAESRQVELYMGMKEYSSALENARQEMTLQADVIKNSRNELEDSIRDQAILEDATRTLANTEKQLAIQLKQQNDPFKKLQGIVEGPVVGEFVKLADALKSFVDTIYKTQQKFGVSFDTAVSLYKDTLLSSVKSFFSAATGKGPFVSQEELLTAGQSFIKQFGTVLTPEEMNRIASEAKKLGVSSEEYVDAKRAFLGTGNEEAVRMRAMSEFAKQGLSAGQAIQFAADNADLLAVAGDKYADSLFRAAAESKKIGVNLRDIEKFANSIVGDFEGSLESFAELSALGVELDFNQLAQVAATGTAEEMQNLLQDQLSMAGITGEELQRNRQVRIALTQTTGLDEATILRLAGVAQAPEEKTLPEKQLAATTETNSRLGQLIEAVGSIGGIFSTAVGVLGTIATTASVFYQAYLTRKLTAAVAGTTTGNIGLPPTTPVTPKPTMGIGGGAKLGAGIGVAAGLISGVTTLFSGGDWKKAIVMTIAPILGGILGGALGTALVTALAATVIGAPIAAAIGPSLIALMSGAGATLAGMAVDKFMGEGKAQGGLITGPGTATSDNIMTPTSPGEFVVNAKATQLYGTDFLNNINTGTYTPPQPVVNNSVTVNNDSLKDELRQIVQSIRNMRIEMNGYEVGHVTANESRTPLRTR